MPVVTTLSGGLVTVDLQTRDFEGYRSDVLDTGGLADLYTPDWSDRSELDLGVALVEAMAFIGDNLSYYQDRCANEALFPSAVQRRSVIEHCKLLGYELAPATSAWVELTFVTTATASTIPAGTSVSVDTSDGSAPASFELTAEFVPPVGGGTTTGVMAYEGVSVVDEVLRPLASGAADQSYSLGTPGLAYNPNGTSSLDVRVFTTPTLVYWTEVDNFLESTPTDTHYRIEIDEFDVVSVIFGDGVNGAIPSTGVVLATYRVGGGHLGNQIAIGKLTRLDGSYSFVTSVTNPVAPTGGINRESIAQAKINAPLSVKAGNRAVTHADYKALALQVPGVLHAHAYRGNGSFEERIVIAGGGSNPIPNGTWDPYTEVATDLIGAVGTYLEARKTTPVILYVDPVRVIETVLVMSVYLYTNVRRRDSIRLLEDAVEALFEASNQTLGQQMPLSRVSEVVERVSGVDYVDLIQMQRIPNPKKVRGGSSTAMTFDDFIVGTATINDTYTISMLTTTTFEVLGASSGYQGAGVVGTQFVASSGAFSMTLNAGSILASNTDRWTLKTGQYLGNINPDFDELVTLRQGSFQLTVNGGVG